jgi:hypothetical protein
VAIFFRCVLRIVIGSMFGVAPASSYLLYGRLAGIASSSAFMDHALLAAEAGILAGAIAGAVWALILLAQRRQIR